MATDAAKLQLLTMCEAAALLNVNERIIRHWIIDESIPYLKLPVSSIGVSPRRLFGTPRDLEGRTIGQRSYRVRH